MQTITRHACCQSKWVCSFRACCTCSADRPFVLKDSTGNWRTKLQRFSGAFGIGTTSHKSFECEKNSGMLNDLAELIKSGIFFPQSNCKVSRRKTSFLFKAFFSFSFVLHPCVLCYACTGFMLIQLSSWPFFVYCIGKSFKWSKFYFHWVFQLFFILLSVSWECNLAFDK